MSDLAWFVWFVGALMMALTTVFAFKMAFGLAFLQLASDTRTPDRWRDLGLYAATSVGGLIAWNVWNWLFAR